MTVDGKQFKFNGSPSFLGVTFDRKISFPQHVTDVKTTANKRMVILISVSSLEWGFDRNLLRCTYLALIRSVLEDGAPACHPWLMNFLMDELERIQNAAARIISGTIARYDPS